MSTMVVVISDLHFEEEQTDAIPTAGPQRWFSARSGHGGSGRWRGLISLKGAPADSYDAMFRRVR
ncbi:MAG: hypothetical protein U1E60_16225 [Reyranellaceae bacterium]